MRYSLTLAVMVFLAAPALADWPNSTVKWDQLGPTDPWAAASWIEYDTPSDALTADDFACDGLPQHQFISDLEFWGFSYYGSAYINQFRVTFWSDVPASPSDESHPGTLLYDNSLGAANPNDPHKLGWQEIETNHFKINLPQAAWFNQGLEPGAKYWVGIQGVMVTDGSWDGFYWSHRDRNVPHFGDDAAFYSNYFGNPPWYNWGFPVADTATGPSLYDGPFPAGWFSSADMAFNLTAIPEPTTLLLLGIGARCCGDANSFDVQAGTHICRGPRELALAGRGSLLHMANTRCASRHENWKMPVAGAPALIGC